MIIENEIQRWEIYRQCLVEQYKNLSCRGETYDDTMSRETLLESLKNLIYWNSPKYLYKEFLDSIALEDSND